jgi:putative tricarboxylic transport membrane protein
MDGVGLVQIAMGMFGISEILLNIEKTVKVTVFETTLKGLFPNLQDWKRSIGAILRGTGIGFFLGILPAGGGYRLFSSYAIEKRLSKNPENLAPAHRRGGRAVRQPTTRRPRGLSSP